MIRHSVVLAVAMIASGCTQPTPPKPSEIGRYMIVHSPHVERDTVLLDTVTGKTWGLVQESELDGAPTAWQPMPQINTPADYETLRQRNGDAAAPTPHAPRAEAPVVPTPVQ